MKREAWSERIRCMKSRKLFFHLTNREEKTTVLQSSPLVKPKGLHYTKGNGSAPFVPNFNEALLARFILETDHPSGTSLGK